MFHLIVQRTLSFIGVEMDGFVFNENSFFEILELCFSSKYDCCSSIFSVADTAYKKIGALIRLLKYFQFTIQSCVGHLVMSGLVLLTLTTYDLNVCRSVVHRHLLFLDCFWSALLYSFIICFLLFFVIQCLLLTAQYHVYLIPFKKNTKKVMKETIPT